MSEIGSRPREHRGRAPGPPWCEVPRLLLRVRRHRIEGLTVLRERYGDILRVPVGRLDLFFLAHPEAARQVLLAGEEGYSKRTRHYEAMKPVLGEGLLTSGGALWQRQRRFIQPAFRHSELAPLVGLVTRETEDALSSWSDPSWRREGFDIAREMARLTLTIVGKAILGVDLSGSSSELGPAVTLLNQHMAEDAAPALELPHWVPTPRNRRFHAAKRAVDREVFERAKAGVSSFHDGLDLVTRLGRARDPETGEAMTETQLRDEIVTLMAAGHETTANALAWTFYCLAQRPEIAEALNAELDSVLGGRVPRLEDLTALGATQRVLQESMRLYPPVWAISRRAERDDVIEGYVVPRGSSMQIIIYLLHRHPDFWQEPERFDPDRFLPERAANRHRFAYLPFGAGHRICVGRDFAMLEAQLILAMVLQRFRLTLAPGHPVNLEPVITLRPRQGMWMRLVDR